MEVIYSLKTIGRTNLVFTYFQFKNPAFHLGISETTLIASSSKDFFFLTFQLYVFNTTRFIDNKFDKNSSCFFVSCSFLRINHTLLDIACHSTRNSTNSGNTSTCSYTESLFATITLLRDQE